MSSFMEQLGSHLGIEISRLDERVDRTKEILEVGTITDRDAIPADDRYLDMWVKVLDSDGQGNATLYQLAGGLSNAAWTNPFEGVAAPAAQGSLDATFFDGKDAAQWEAVIAGQVATRAASNHDHNNVYLPIGGTSVNSSKLGGNLPSHFAEASRVADIETLLQSDDVTLDSVQELVNYIKTNRGDIDALTPEGIGAAPAIHTHHDMYLDIDGTAKNALRVNGLTVDTAVPAGAVFTDTVYTHPVQHQLTDISGLTVALDSKVTKTPGMDLSSNDFTAALKSRLESIEIGATGDQTKEEIDALGINAASVNGHLIGKSVPANALFTDTIYDDTALSGRVTSLENSITLVSYDQERIDAVNSVIDAYTQADSDLENTINLLLSEKMDNLAVLDGGTF